MENFCGERPVNEDDIIYLTVTNALTCKTNLEWLEGAFQQFNPLLQEGRFCIILVRAFVNSIVWVLTGLDWFPVTIINKRLGWSCCRRIISTCNARMCAKLDYVDNLQATYCNTSVPTANRFHVRPVRKRQDYRRTFHTWQGVPNSILVGELRCKRTKCTGMPGNLKVRFDIVSYRCQVFLCMVRHL